MPRRMKGADRINTFFGEMLETRRLDLDLEPEDVAYEAGCSRATVLYHEGGACFLPRPSLMFGFAAALQLRPADMFLAAYYSMPKCERIRFLTGLRAGDSAMADEILAAAA